MKLPSFQFYPGDWQKDPNLRRCTHSAKGVWIDILCLMWEGDERGVLISNGRPWTDDEIAMALGGDKAAVLGCIEELTLKGVSNRRDDGALICRRMVRDENKRKLCVEAGKRGGNPNLRPTLKGASKGQVNGESKGDPNRNPTPSSSSSSSINNPLPPKGGKGRKDSLKEVPTTPNAKRVAAIYGRRETTGWDEREKRAFQKLGQISEDDLSAVEAYYKGERENPDNCLRRDLSTFLNNFRGEVDRARAWIEKSKQPRKGIPGPAAKRPDRFENPMDKAVDEFFANGGAQ